VRFRKSKSHPPHQETHPRTTIYDFLLQNVREITAKSYMKRLRQLGKLGDLDNPERMKTLICTYPASESRKELLADAYDYYVRFKNLKWKKPRFTREDKPIFVPLESELDMLISKAHFKISVWLEFLKETGVDSGEAGKLCWIDVDNERKTVSITPTKNHNARTLPITNHLRARLNQLTKKSERVFPYKDFDSWARCYTTMRKRLSAKLQNQRLSKISFRTFRHWKATAEYAKTKDILHIKWLLGHKRIENTLVYTHLIDFHDDEFVCRVAKTISEATALIESGFSYVCEMEGVKLFKKRKWKVKKLTGEELGVLKQILAELKEANQHLRKIENQTFGY
jgi:integrase